MNSIAIHIILFFIFLLLGFVYRKYALRKKILDKPTKRSSHTKPVVRGGGIIFFSGILAAILLKFHFFIEHFWGFITGFMILSFTGFLDDRKNLSPVVRFPFQILAVVFILHAAGLWNADFPLWIKLTALIVSAGFVNAFNFMDGINGITGFYAIAVLSSLLYLNRLFFLYPNELLTIPLTAILAFGFFNFRKKALMFAGDIGSMALASLILFILASFMVKLKSPLLLLLVLVYGVDSAMTIIFRLIKKQNIFQAHRWHVYQKWVDRYRMSHLSVAFIYAGIQSIVNFWILKYRLWEIKTSQQFLALFLVLFIFVMLYTYHQKEKILE